MEENKSDEMEIKATGGMQIKIENTCVLSPNELQHYTSAADMAKIYLAERDNRVKAFVQRVVDDMKFSSKQNLRKKFKFTYNKETNIKYRLGLRIVRKHAIQILKQLGYDAHFDDKDSEGREQSNNDHVFTFHVEFAKLIEDEYK